MSLKEQVSLTATPDKLLELDKKENLSNHKDNPNLQGIKKASANMCNGQTHQKK